MSKFIPGAVAVAILAATGLSFAYAAGEHELDAAREAASDYRYALAFANYRAAATLGNREAQRSAGLMALYGERLYGAEVARNRSEALQWLNRAAAQGCAVSAYMVRRMTTAHGDGTNPPPALAVAMDK